MIKSIFHKQLYQLSQNSWKGLASKEKQSFNKISPVESKPTKIVSLNLGLHTRHPNNKNSPVNSLPQPWALYKADNRVSPVSFSPFSSHNLGLCTRQINHIFMCQRFLTLRIFSHRVIHTQFI